MPQNWSDCPWDLLMVIAKASLIGNCNLLNSTAISVGIIGIRGIRTSSPLYLPVIIVASTKLVLNFFTTNRVPLHNRGGLMFRSKEIATPTFNRKRCAGMPGMSREFKNSQIKSTFWLLCGDVIRFSFVLNVWRMSNVRSTPSDLDKKYRFGISGALCQISLKLSYWLQKGTLIFIYYIDSIY